MDHMISGAELFCSYSCLCKPSASECSRTVSADLAFKTTHLWRAYEKMVLSVIKMKYIYPLRVRRSGVRTTVRARLRPHPDRPQGPPGLCTMCTGSLLRGLNDQDVALTSHLFPPPGSSMENLYLYLPSVSS